jgi:hypothetical protein
MRAAILLVTLLLWGIMTALVAEAMYADGIWLCTYASYFYPECPYSRVPFYASAAIVLLVMIFWLPLIAIAATATRASKRKASERKMDEQILSKYLEVNRLFTRRPRRWLRRFLSGRVGGAFFGG